MTLKSYMEALTPPRTPKGDYTGIQAFNEELSENMATSIGSNPMNCCS